MQKREAPNALRTHAHFAMTAKQDMETQSIQCHVQDMIVVIVIIRPTPV